ncbi:phosphoglycerate mutase [Suttonella ornithocola]|uniref:Phosphoglycerate mutase n=2 Tax=Suttonella ornithocola TaxID=279832 RepID=A0A380MUQ4_9GAMM|nr:phosphoglycerate mutase [Suttonella ornithocola]
MNMKYIYLVRHAQSHANAGGKAMLNRDIPITELGESQAEKVAEWLMNRIGKNNITSIGISKFLRTKQTAMPLSEITEICPTVIHGLEEFNYLSFDSIADKTLSERRKLAEDYWLEFSPDDRDGSDAESFSQFVQRVEQVQRYFQELPNGHHVVFTHGLWMSMLIWLMLGQATASRKSMSKFRQFEISIRPKNTEIYWLTMASHYPAAIQKIRSKMIDF